MRVWILPLAVIAITASAPAAGPELEHARKLYNLTDFQQSLKVLQAIPSKDGAVYEMIGRNYYMEGDYKRSSEALQRAVELDPSSSEFALWLARALGRRAETSSPFTAPGYASKARQYFERAVKLNPGSLEAQSDLFEYYLEAPGFLGGGLDKAENSARALSGINPVEGQWAAAKLAEHRKEYSRAEEHLRRAIDLAPQQVGRVLDLARFLVRQGRFPEADQNLARADTIAPNSPKVMFAKAEIYIKAKQNLNVAVDLLKRYMASNITPDDPPKSDAAKLLKQVSP